MFARQPGLSVPERAKVILLAWWGLRGQESVGFPCVYCVGAGPGEKNPFSRCIWVRVAEAGSRGGNTRLSLEVTCGWRVPEPQSLGSLLGKPPSTSLPAVCSVPPPWGLQSAVEVVSAPQEQQTRSSRAVFLARWLVRHHCLGRL